MHFTVLVTGDIPAVQEDFERNKRIEGNIKELESMHPVRMDAVLHAICLAELKSRKTMFSRKVEELVDSIMEPYSIYECDPKQLEFEDQTQMLMDKFQNGCSDFLRFPNGKTVEIGEFPFYWKYAVKDGKVYEKNVGPLHHMKRTKHSKKMKALLSYPYSKVYKSLDEYAEERYGLDFDEEHGGYGIYYNPKSRYDGYLVGGSYEEMFLVSSDCTEYSNGRRICWPVSQKRAAPEGYMWVCAARKKDIVWSLMRDWNKKELTEEYRKLQRMFERGHMEPDYLGEIVEDGIIRFGNYLYHKGESLDSFLERCSYSDASKYPVLVSDIVDEESWLSSEDCEDTREMQRFAQWDKQIEDYIDALSEDTVLIAVDCHL